MHPSQCVEIYLALFVSIPRALLLLCGNSMQTSKRKVSTEIRTNTLVKDLGPGPVWHNLVLMRTTCLHAHKNYIALELLSFQQTLLHYKAITHKFSHNSHTIYNSSFPPPTHPSPAPNIQFTPTSSNLHFRTHSSAPKLLLSTNSSPPTSSLLRSFKSPGSR